MIAATHDGPHHADDAMAAAILRETFGDVEFIRTREPEELEEADVVFDVGGVYDHTARRYDHHQGVIPCRWKSGGRPRGYAAAGLLWRHYGPGICVRALYRAAGTAPSLSNARAVYRKVDKMLLAPIDNWDNGIRPDQSAVQTLPFQHVVSVVSFRTAVALCRRMLRGIVFKLSREVATVDRLDRDLARGRGNQMWCFGNLLMVESEPDFKLPLGAAKRVYEARIGLPLAAVVSPMRDGKWALLFANLPSISPRQRRYIEKNFPSCDIHRGGRIVFARGPDILIGVGRHVMEHVGQQ